ncbi:hypothetical protein PYW07_010277 [Mythimna separata]|uniref:DEK-C domain-containing protein n=1 Tax=Mythimna separata TaxID=271217 RepID=A0AAD7YH47_MYTSE|nr:hypothetical protein PYW07_010277 [Mythimna separata]
MAETENEITKEELQKEIAEILDKSSLESTSTKKVIQKLEKKLGVDLTEKKKLIDQLVMDYVNSLDSDDDSVEEEPLAKAAKKKVKADDDEEEDEDENDDSNDSDWGHYHHDGHLLDGYSDDGYRPLQQEATVSTSETRRLSNQPRQAVILKRVAQTSHEDDEADIFGKLTAKKLRKLSDEKRDYMMIQINQLFYDKCYKRKVQPKPRMADKGTSTLPSVQYEAKIKKIYRVGTIPKNYPAAAPVPIMLANLHKPVVTSTNKLKTSAPLQRTAVPSSSSSSPSNVPEPVVQVAATPMPTVAPTTEAASQQTSTPGYKCGLM